MTAKEFSKKFGFTERYALMLLSGEKTASKKLGKRLEKKTGIPRTAWCWPEDFPNPMITKKRRSNRNDLAQH